MSPTATLPVEVHNVTPAAARLSGLRFDPRIWLLAFLSAAVWISASDSMLLLCGICVALVLALALSQPDSRTVTVSPWTMLRWVMIAAAFTITFYAIFGPRSGGEATGVLGLRIEKAALLLGVTMAVKLIALLLLSGVLLRQVSPLELAAGITRLGSPLRHIGIPVSNFFYLSFFLTRMIPDLIQESRMIALAQRSRGVALKRWKAYPALALPLFASALRRGDNMALLLASRGFDSDKMPLRVLSLRLGVFDFIGLSALALGWSAWLYWQLR